MGETRAYTYLGAVQSEQRSVKRHLIMGEFTALNTDAYASGGRPSLTFAQISNITKVVALFMGNATSGWVPTLASLSGNVITVALFEGSAAGTTLTEKPDEAYGANVSICAIVAGI